MIRVFDIGDRIEITPVKAVFSEDKSEKKYVSQLLDFDDIRTAKISTPLQDGRIIPLRVDQDVRLCFFTKSGLYQCKARIKKRYIEDKIPMMDVLLISEPEKYQRRRFYRLECTYEINYRRLSLEEVRIRRDLESGYGDAQELKKQLEDIPQDWKTGVVTNLSGGGIRFHLGESLDIGEMIELDIPISLKNGVVPMKVFSHVIDCTGDRPDSKDVRCEFDSIGPKERELVVKYVFEEQRRRMSGGKA